MQLPRRGHHLHAPKHVHGLAAFGLEIVGYLDDAGEARPL